MSDEGPSLFAERDPAAPTPARGHHDHCRIALQAHVGARQPGRVRVLQPTALIAAAPVPAEQPRLRSLAPYRLAPKASPPAVAAGPLRRAYTELHPPARAKNF